LTERSDGYVRVI